MADSPVAKMLSGAKDALTHAKNLTTSVEGKPTSSVGASDKTPAASPAAKPSIATRIRTGISSGLKEASKEASDTAEGLKWREEQRRQVPTYHKGGKIKKDGEQVINAEKGETVLPKKDKEKALDLAVKHLKGMSDGMSSKKTDEKEESKPKAAAKKRHGKVKHMHIEVADDNTYIVKHQHEPNEDGTMPKDTTHSKQDMDELIEHLQEHLGEPNQGEAEADAGEHGIPDEHMPKES